MGPVIDISPPTGRAFAPQIASDADGDVVITWLRFDGNRDRVQARTMTPAGALGALQTITPSGPSSIAPQVATDTDGDSVFAWERFEGGFDRTQARTMNAAGTLGGIQNLSSTGGEAFEAQVASAASGASAFAWLRSDGTNDRVQARTMSAAGAFAGVVDLSVAGADASTPEISMAANNGAIVAVWERSDTIQVTKGP